MTLTATNNSDNAYKIGKIMGDELTHLGINMNLAPSLDVNNNPDNPVIGVRSYSDNPKTVSEYGNKYIKGLQEKGVIATAKHFPGHGDTNVDSHLGLPMITHTLEELEKVELVPFKSAIKNGVDAIMSAHIVFSEIDKSGLPGTLSKVILNDLLRERLNFKGIIVSDCMQMKAIDDQYTTERGTLMGIKAGLDIACISHDLEKQVGALKLIEKAVLKGEISEDLIDEKVERILSYKEKTKEKVMNDFVSFTNEEIIQYFKLLNNQEVASDMVDRSLTLFKGKAFVQNGRTLVIAASPFAQSNAEDKIDSRNIVDMIKEFAQTVDAEKLDLKSQDYSYLYEKAKNYDQVVVCSYNANTYPAQIKLINDINKLGKELYVISTRNPYDYLVLDEIDNIACVYEYTKNSVNTIVRYLNGMIKPKGKFPINSNNKLGVSASLYVGLEEYPLKRNLEYLKMLKKNGIDTVFVSAHMPEMNSKADEELQVILQAAKKLNIKIILDVNKDRLMEMEKDGKLTLDLYPRKGKNTHGFCFGIDQEADARILANLTNNSMSLETLNHELGHCIYTLGTVKTLPFFDREQYPAMTEAIAMMMQDLQKREDVLKDLIPQELLNEYRKNHIKDEVNFICKALTLINFEKEMYKNPEQDLKKLWHDMKVKYQMRSEKEDLDNGWATIPHFLSHPAYYQNYFRATIIKAQIYNYLKEKLGNITENPKTSEILKKELFQYGISMEENELIENMTGRKLSVDDFIKSLNV